MLRSRRIANAAMTGWLPDHAVVVEGSLITGITPQAALPRTIGESHAVYDLDDVSLLPGLVDVHAHMHCSATPDAYQLVSRLPATPRSTSRGSATRSTSSRLDGR